MPANEQTWRDSKLLHRLFGVSSALMLLATMWMFAVDHNREWKPIQRTANRLEMTLTDWRRSQLAIETQVGKHGDLAKQVQDARRQPIERGLLEAFEAEVRKDPKTEKLSLDGIWSAFDKLTATSGEAEAEGHRDAILESLRRIIRDARFREETVLGDRKFKSADRDAAVAELGILVRDSVTLSPEEATRLQDQKQRQIDQLTQQLADLSAAYDRAKRHRSELDRLLKQMTAAEDSASEALDKSQADLEQLKKANLDRRSTYIVWMGFLPLPGKRLLELPILDAFNSPRKIDNLWSTGLEIDYNFRKVRRFDRCTTCHQLIEKTLPGSAVDPSYLQESFVDFRIVPAEEPAEAAEAAGSGESATAEGGPAAAAVAESAASAADKFAARLDAVVGVKFAAEGLLATGDATIQYVRPQSPASLARAIPPSDPNRVAEPTGAEIRNGLLATQGPRLGAETAPGLTVGDVVVSINGSPVMHPEKVASGLMDSAATGRPFVVTVRRGLPTPYTTHPRLDLFVSSVSPHKSSEFAFTICHDGQGSATAFQWASHTPNSVRQREDWVTNQHWHDNPHWIYPMFPKRFAESACLKCHHGVTELEPSERFPDAPAPKVVHGYHLVQKYGCYGCHEINGYDGPRSLGPDLRLEPNFFAAALQLKSDPGFAQLPVEQQDWVGQLIDHPERDAVRRRLLEALTSDGKSESPMLSRDSHDRIVPLLRDIESPGELRKSGPSLRFIGHKVDASFLYDWIREPKHFRPTTRMPQFFGLWDHLHHGPGIEDAQKFEPIEVLGVVTYLQQRTQKFDFLVPPTEVTESPDKQRGRVQFMTRGCLACHTHDGFADASKYRSEDEIVQGPDLSAVGDKFSGEKGRQWLYSWIKEPTRYHARTVMPDLYLTPIKGADGKVTDPAADIVEYLLSESRKGWKPAAGTLTSADQLNAENLQAYMVENLSEVFSVERAVEYARRGIPESMRAELKGAESELVVSNDNLADAGFQLTAEQQLVYLGRKTLAKYGCYGCHDVPGFEDAKPIGTGLADWGRKDSARLAFEHITHYLESPKSTAAAHGGHVGQSENAGEPAATAGAGSAPASASPPAKLVAYSYEESADESEYWLEQIKSAHRAGFIYQKLREPRSYDYHKTENKHYYERLRMPHFPFDAADREAVVTFVLGLVADPPSDKYIYHPSEHAQALLGGRKVLEKYNCGGCHVLGGEKWRIAFPADRYGQQPTTKTFPFVASHFDSEQLAASAKTDRAGLARTTIEGMPAVDDQGIPMAYDDAGDALDNESPYDPSKLEFSFELWQPAMLGGEPYDVGVLALSVLATDLEKRYGTDGGFLAKYLLPHVVALEKQANPAAKGSEAWGWLPPPLLGEGNKVQTDWLHSFLLNPYPIRPATFLRMPRFNLSSAEASQLVNYFAAKDGAEFPYAAQSRQQARHLETEESAYQQALQGVLAAGAGTQGAGTQGAGTQGAGTQGADEARTRLLDAMRMVVNNNYCVKCHLVGDFEPAGSDRAKAPNLAQVYQRLRPDYVRKWIANPKSLLPYTSMPVNIPYDPDAPNLGGISQDLYHGTSVQQVDALVDLLMNYDEFAKRRSSIAELVKRYGGPAAPATTTGAAATGGGQ